MKIQDAHLPTDQGDTPSKQECEFVPEGIIINEVQLLLAEKRTSLSTMRTGITVFVLPLSVLSVLIATSKYYDVLQVMHLINTTARYLFSTGLIGFIPYHSGDDSNAPS